MLNTIFEEVGEMGLDGEFLLNEIMQRVKQYNYLDITIEKSLSKEIHKAYKTFLEEKK